MTEFALSRSISAAASSELPCVPGVHHEVQVDVSRAAAVVETDADASAGRRRVGRPRKPRECKYCGKVFPESKGRNHVINHQLYYCDKAPEVRRFSCIVCNAVYRDPSVYRRHLTTKKHARNAMSSIQRRFPGFNIDQKDLHIAPSSSADAAVVADVAAAMASAVGDGTDDNGTGVAVREQLDDCSGLSHAQYHSQQQQHQPHQHQINPAPDLAVAGDPQKSAIVGDDTPRRPGNGVLSQAHQQQQQHQHHRHHPLIALPLTRAPAVLQVTPPSVSSPYWNTGTGRTSYAPPLLSPSAWGDASLLYQLPCGYSLNGSTADSPATAAPMLVPSSLLSGVSAPSTAQAASGGLTCAPRGAGSGMRLPIHSSQALPPQYLYSDEYTALEKRLQPPQYQGKQLELQLQHHPHQEDHADQHQYRNRRQRQQPGLDGGGSGNDEEAHGDDAHDDIATQALQLLQRQQHEHANEQATADVQEAEAEGSSMQMQMQKQRGEVDQVMLDEDAAVAAAAALRHDNDGGGDDNNDGIDTAAAVLQRAQHQQQHHHQHHHHHHSQQHHPCDFPE